MGVGAGGPIFTHGLPVMSTNSNHTNPCSNLQIQLQHRDDSPGHKAGRLSKRERANKPKRKSSVMFLVCHSNGHGLASSSGGPNW